MHAGIRAEMHAASPARLPACPNRITPRPEQGEAYIHPSAIIGVDKISQMLAKLEINAKILFRYFLKQSAKIIKKKEFLKVIQSFNLPFSADDMLILYQYFDDKAYGEISEQQFTEKFEYLSRVGCGKMSHAQRSDFESRGATPVKQQPESSFRSLTTTQEAQKIQRMQNKSQAQTVMLKIFAFMKDRRYAKHQLRQIFDRNGSGFINRIELLEVLSHLGLDVSLSKAQLFAQFVDEENLSQIQVDEILKTLFANVPHELRQDFNQLSVSQIFKEIVSQLKTQVQAFKDYMIQFEKNVRPTDIYSLKQEQKALGIIKAKSGININDFYKLFRAHSIKLSEDEKLFLKATFQLSANPEYLDLEQIYDHFDRAVTLATTRASSDVEKLLQGTQNSYLQETKVYRQIVAHMKATNTTLRRLLVGPASSLEQQQAADVIAVDAFKKALNQLDLGITDKEMNALLAKHGQEASREGGQPSGTAVAEGMVDVDGF